MKASGKLDEVDLKLLDRLQDNCLESAETLSQKLGVSRSTIRYRMRKLGENGIIEKYYAKADPSKLGKDYLTVTFVYAKYGPEYHKKLGESLGRIKGVWAVYFVLGEIDFVVLTRANNRDDYLRILKEMMTMEGIERTSTQIVLQIIKEDPKVEM
ncbi:MAG: Lrp/AsnC family transcriptional regulator [Candidatus Bathyarchaeia archaeon]